MKHNNMELYNQLLDLTDNNKSFFFKDFVKDGYIYRIFNYRLVSYTEFLIPGAMECRGIMFLVDDKGQYEKLVSRPMAKFFNLYQNPMTMDLDLNKVINISEKADGSLISTYVHKGKLLLKSKGSLESTQAIDSIKFLYEKDQEDLLTFLIFQDHMGYTINMEWCSPDNRIVLAYDKPQLKILNIRNRLSGKYLDLYKSDQLEFKSIISKYAVEKLQITDHKSFIDKVPDIKDSIEGFVCEMNDGLLFKVKTLGYLALHHTKDSINCPRRLYEAVLEEATDDLRSMFTDDPQAIKLIQDMEILVENMLNTLITEVESTYNEYKHLDRKNYAISCQKSMSKISFSLAMNLYLDKPFSYKDFMKKHYDNFISTGDDNA